MRGEFLARLKFRPLARLQTPARVVGLAKLPDDEPGHPFGQWSVIANLWDQPDEHGVAQAYLSFASPDAPRGAIMANTTFPLFIGPNMVAEIDILDILHHSSSESATYDSDFLAGRRTRARNIGRSTTTARGIARDARH